MNPIPNIITKCEAKAGPVGSTLSLYGDIGLSPFGDGISAEQVKTQLQNCKGPLAVYINSAGGSVFEGLAIYNQLKRYSGRVTCYVDGMAASIASVIAMAGATLVMSKASLMMIHEAHGVVAGTAADMEKCAADLRKITDTIRGVYITKTGLPENIVSEMMAAETWMSAEDCVKQHFADALDEEDAPVDRITAKATLLDTYRNTPQHLRSAPYEIAVAKMQMTIQQMQLQRSPKTINATRPAENIK